ncbi:MAG: rhomboid family intramembrane serine protease [Bacteroidetes bacterium]|nr:rhomboid family intramembrane serine protease [Bacteroidota bacterium]MDA1121426.1 rhomboid family intramembrane serine protease [Bacteroidota bacterium]
MNSGFFDDFKNVWNRPDNGLIQLIIINVIIFIGFGIINVFSLWSRVGSFESNFVMPYLALPSNVEDFVIKPWTLISYGFIHHGFLHILFNMLFLYWFGKLIKEYLGGQRVLSIFFLGIIAGGLLYIILYNFLPLFQDSVHESRLLGASAGVFAIVVGAATFMPNYTLMLLFIGPVRIKYIAIFYVLLSFLQSAGANAGGEIAHLGGAIMGFVYIKQLHKGNDWGTPIAAVMNWVKSFFVRQPKIKVSYSRKEKSRTKTSSNVSRGEQDEIDTILDKISESGYESLSSDEKQKLFNASKK